MKAQAIAARTYALKTTNYGKKSNCTDCSKAGFL
ncbi:SpoIID/LytB domain-containing protein [Lysinibacillus sp. MHQ-1]|nr:SpoIID/LytB domain-containing protein [Lysinibacillus sp. MHQ-1]